jgi:hypothetical protein
MPTKKNHEGYLLIDHRESPGVSPEQAAAVGLPVGAHRGVFEAGTYTCNHCCRVVVINPLRTRSREYCAKCDCYICDGCGATKALTGECRTMAQIIEETQEAASRQPIFTGA